MATSSSWHTRQVCQTHSRLTIIITIMATRVAMEVAMAEATSSCFLGAWQPSVFVRHWSCSLLNEGKKASACACPTVSVALSSYCVIRSWAIDNLSRLGVCLAIMDHGYSIALCTQVGFPIVSQFVAWQVAIRLNQKSTNKRLYKPLVASSTAARSRAAQCLERLQRTAWA